MTTLVGRCAVCGMSFMRADVGRPRITCSNACRQEAYRRRHPLGWQLLRDLGIEDRSPLEMLRQAGVDAA